MLPRTHTRVIREACALAGQAWLADRVEDLLRGHRDEDDLVLPGVRLPAFGFTHTERPGSPRGELLFPSAGLRGERLVRRARSLLPRNPAEAAWVLGRACHLLCDAGVPARARRVWHFRGDPLEVFVEAHLDRLAPEPRLPPYREPRRLFQGLARIAAGLPADTTRTAWGAARFRWLGRGCRLASDEIEAQAAWLLGHQIGYTAALLRGASSQKAGDGRL